MPMRKHEIREGIEKLLQSENFARHEGPEPPISGFQIGVSAEVMAAIGFVILQWAALENMIDIEIDLMRDPESALPDDLKTRHRIRPEFKYRTDFLRRCAEHIYAKGRNNAVVLYRANLDSCHRLKAIRDSLAHGTFSRDDNQEQIGVVIRHKGRRSHYRLDRLIRTATEIGQCHAFFLDFRSWYIAPEQRASLEKWLELNPG